MTKVLIGMIDGVIRGWLNVVTIMIRGYKANKVVLIFTNNGKISTN